MCYTDSACCCGSPSRCGHCAHRKRLFSLTQPDSVGLILLCFFRGGRFLLRIWRKKGGEDSFLLVQPSSRTPCCCAAGPTTTVTNWTRCYWLCTEGNSLLPTKTHTSLDVNGSHGTYRGTLHDDTTQGNYGIYKKSYSLGRVSFKLLLPLYPRLLTVSKLTPRDCGERASGGGGV